jgi:hypothetical protein
LELKSPKSAAHLFGKNIFVRENELEFKGSLRLKNQKPQELIALRVSKIRISGIGLS